MTRTALCRRGGLTTLLGALLLAGCSSQPLRIADNGAPLVLARATLRPAGDAGGGGIEVELARVRAEQLQPRDSFDWVRLGGVELDGAPALLNEARHSSLQLVYHHRLFAGRPGEMAWFVGAAAGELDWRSTEQGGSRRQASTRARWAGPTGGASGRWNMTPSLFGEVRYAGTWAISGDDGGFRTHAELALGWQMAAAVQLRVGMANTTLELWPDSSSTKLSLRTRGPFAALVVGY